MVILIICVVIALLIVLFYILTSDKEHFYASTCQELNSEYGLTCSIPNSPLYSNKCYRVKQSMRYPDGKYEHINVDNCTDYPDCREIGDKCNARDISKLGNGYIERL